jgi:aldehyde dehydrogenase (NAD+)
MGYIDSGKEAGATVHHGGERHGDEGYFIKPTIFTDVHPDMKIVKEEIFGPVAAIIKFKDEAEVVEMANNTTYGVAAHIFTQNVNRSIRVAHAVEAGTVWVCRLLCFVFFVLYDLLCGCRSIARKLLSWVFRLEDTNSLA